MSFLRVIGLLLLCIAISPEITAQQSAKKKPNIIIIIGDDCTFSDLPLYGGTNVKTPRIDKLAAEGLVFNKAYLSMAMCAPSRAELYTGLYPMSNGVCWNHGTARTGVKGMAQYLKPLGYRVGLAGKTHINPQSVYQFEKVAGVTGNSVAAESDFDPAGVTEFVNRDHQNPFCLVVAFTSPHVPWTVGNPAHFDPKTIQLPPHAADTKEMREDFTKYLAEIEVLDNQVGQVLDILDTSGEAENTVVIFTSEQGAQMPGAKWTNYDIGTHTAFVMKWPGPIKAGRRTDALMQYCDVLPTLVDIAGGSSTDQAFDGSSLLAVLQAKTEKHRDYVYFMHNNVPEGPPYPIRAVSDGTHTYIRNLMPENIYVEKHVMGELNWHTYWPSWMYGSADNARTFFLLNRYLHRPAEELYDLVTDPGSFTNRIQDKKLTSVKQRLSTKLDAWMKAEHDPGKILDQPDYEQAAKSGKHKL